MALDIQNICVSQDGKPVVHDVSLSVEAGHVTAILGANGAGKSELVLAIAGVLPVTAGTITVDDVAITGATPDVIRRAGVAAVPEGHQVLSRLSVDDNLRVAGVVLSNEDLEVVLAETYEVFPELAERKAQIAGTMSGGQQQMLAIGHALMSRPKYVLIDEMSLGLAPLIVSRLVAVVRAMAERGVGVILVEQFTEVALQLADKVLVLRSGVTQFNGSCEELRGKQHILDEAYF